jgi:hypothetical protein
MSDVIAEELRTCKLSRFSGFRMERVANCRGQKKKQSILSPVLPNVETITRGSDPASTEWFLACEPDEDFQ